MVAFSRCRMAVTGGLAGLLIALLPGPVAAQQVDISRIQRPLLPGSTWRSGSSARNSRSGNASYNESDPTVVTFRTTTTDTNLTSAGWVVTTAQTYPSQVVAEGQAGVFKAGQSLQFSIDFRPIAGSTTTRPLTYSVHARGYRNVRYGTNPPPPVLSLPIRVMFSGSGPTTTFTFEGLRPELAASMPIGLRLQSLWSDGDTDIEPYLLVAVVYTDGTTIVPEVSGGRIRFTDSRVRLAGASGTHGNVLGGDAMDAGDTVPIPASTGIFDTTIRPIGLQLANQLGLTESNKRMLREKTQVGVVIIGMEEDAIPSTETANELYAAFIAGLQEELDTLVRSVELTAGNVNFPNLASAVEAIKKRLRERLEALAKSETIADLKPFLAIPAAPMLATFGAANADDYIGAAHIVVTYQQLLDAGEAGIPFQLEISDNPDEAVLYKIKGRFFIR